MEKRGKLLFALFIPGLLAITSCVEIFNFNTDQEQEILIIDGFVSDLSYSDLSDEPLDSRYFEVRLKVTSAVGNSLDEPVSGAEVQVIDDLNEHWDYDEEGRGVYRLFYKNFKALENRAYQLRVTLGDGRIFESDLELLPTKVEKSQIVYEEKQIRDYRVVASEVQIVSVDGLSIGIKSPTFDLTQEVVRTKWDFETTYGFVAWLNPSRSDPNFRCWITEQLYYNDFEIAEQTKGGVTKDLFFFDTKDENLHEGFSVLVREQSLSETYYQFWQDLKNQEKQAELFAPPPYNLLSNLKPVGHDTEVYGFFGVVREQFYRWTFSKDMVSYPTPYPETLKNSCFIPRPPRSCFDCRFAPLVSRSSIVNKKPIWWEN